MVGNGKGAIGRFIVFKIKLLVKQKTQKDFTLKIKQMNKLAQ